MLSKSYGEMSAELGQHLEVISDQLIKDRKLKRAASMIDHARNIYERNGSCSSESCHRLALARVSLLFAKLQQAQLEFHKAEDSINNSLDLCHQLLHTSIDNQGVPMCTHLAVERAWGIQELSVICRAFQKFTISQDNAKLGRYQLKKIARVARDALCAYSAILLEQATDTHKAVLCAIAAAKISRKCDGPAATNTLLAECHVCTSMAQHILKQRASPFYILSPWHCNRLAARYFLMDQVSHSIIEANPAIQHRVRACWIKFLDQTGFDAEEHAPDGYSPEFTVYCAAVQEHKGKQTETACLKLLAEGCLHAKAIAGTAHCGDRMRIQLATAYMALSEVRHPLQVPSPLH